MRETYTTRIESSNRGSFLLYVTVIEMLCKACGTLGHILPQQKEDWVHSHYMPCIVWIEGYPQYDEEDQPHSDVVRVEALDC